MANPTITDAQLEELLSSNKAQAVNRAPIVAGEPSIPPQFDPLSGGVLPDVFGGLQTDVARSQVPGALPTYRVARLAPSGQPQQGSAIISGVKITPTETKTSDSVQLNIPSIFAPVSQIVTLPGPLSFDLAPEPADTFLAGPQPIAGGFVDSEISNIGVDVIAPLTLTNTSTNSTWFYAVQVELATSSLTGPSGYTPLFTVGTNSYVGYEHVAAPGTNTAQATWTTGLGSNTYGAALLALGGTMTKVQQSGGNWNDSSGPLPIDISPTSAGNSLIMVIWVPGNGATLANPALGHVITDTQNNAWTFVCGDGYVQVYLAPNIAGGASTIVTITPTGAPNPFYYYLTEWSGNTSVPTLPNIPTFRKIVGPDLPTPTATTLGGVLANSAVSHEFVTQINTSGAPVLAQPAYTDISGDPSQAGFFQTHDPFSTASTYTTQVGDRGRILYLSNPGSTGCTITLANGFWGWFYNYTPISQSAVLTIANITTVSGTFGNLNLISGKGCFIPAGTSIPFLTP